MRTIKFIQINIYKGKYLENLIDFLKKEDPDFVSMQEVTTGIQNLCSKNIDLPRFLEKKLGYNGVFSYDFQTVIGKKNGLQGNAVYSKHKILKRVVIRLKKSEAVKKEIADNKKFFPIAPRHLLVALCNLPGHRIHLMSWHGAWTAPPTDTSETLRQAKIVASYLKELNEPFILGGDLNNTIESKTVGLINKVANNLMFKASVKMTTHPKIHKIAPRGFLIDYVFVSKHFKLKSVTVPEVLVSDHLPVVAEVELAN